MFNYISAGATYPTYGGICIYVKYKKRKGPYKESNFPQGRLFHLIDREILMVAPGGREFNHSLLPTNYDYAVNADYFGINTAVKHTGLMFIYEKQASARRHRLDKASFIDKKLFVDSGGFKLASGTESFIDPADLAAYYNLYAHQGMCLDLPILRITDINIILRHAEVHKQNTKVLLNNLDSNVTLYNISHGRSDDMRKRYINHVYNDKLDHWAVGGSKAGEFMFNPFDFLGRIFLTINEVGGFKKVKSIHVFGIADNIVIPVLAWLGNYIDLTSDASSSIRKAVTSRCNEFHGRIIRNVRVGKTENGIYMLDKFPQSINCNCGICSALGSNELYYKCKMDSAGAFLLAMHNTNTMSAYSNYWQELASISSLEEYKKQYLHILQSQKLFTPKHKNLWLSSLDYIEEFVTGGLNKANKKYGSFKTSELAVMLDRGCPSKINTFEEEIDTSYGNLKRMKKILINYEKFHKIKKRKR